MSKNLGRLFVSLALEPKSSDGRRRMRNRGGGGGDWLDGGSEVRRGRIWRLSGDNWRRRGVGGARG